MAKEENANYKGDAEDSTSIQPANIIVAGITGTGKSTLINAVFGFEDSKGAKTGTGKPITDHMDTNVATLPANIKTFQYIHSKRLTKVLFTYLLLKISAITPLLFTH